MDIYFIAGYRPVKGNLLGQDEIKLLLSNSKYAIVSYLKLVTITYRHSDYSGEIKATLD